MQIQDNNILLNKAISITDNGRKKVIEQNLTVRELQKAVKNNTILRVNES